MKLAFGSVVRLSMAIGVVAALITFPFRGMTLLLASSRERAARKPRSKQKRSGTLSGFYEMP